MNELTSSTNAPGAHGATSPEAMGYAEWVRYAIKRSRERGGRVVTLFDSSVPEPTQLLMPILADALSAPVDPRYTSAFIGGNPYVVAHLASAYGVDSSQVLCTTGATSALALICNTLAARGDHVLIESPGFDLFELLARRSGLDVTYFSRSGPEMAIDIAEIAAAIRPNTRMIILSNLHNPSGAAVPHSTLESLGELASSRDILVVVDEVYGNYADSETRPCPASSVSPRFISVSSLTKIYGLSTLRCGWIVARADLISLLRTHSEKSELSISNLSHAAAALVFENAPLFDAYTAEFLASARPIMADYAERWRRDGLIQGDLPPFGCIFFPRLVGIDDTLAFSNWLCERSGVIVAAGEYFGAPGRIRIGFAQTSDNLIYGLEALEEGLRAYSERAGIDTPAIHYA